MGFGERKGFTRPLQYVRYIGNTYRSFFRIYTAGSPLHPFVPFWQLAGEANLSAAAAIETRTRIDSRAEERPDSAPLFRDRQSAKGLPD